MTSLLPPHEETPASRPRERPKLRERAIRFGVDSLEDDELVALIVGHGRPGEPLLARVRRLWGEAGGLSGLASHGVGALSTELGLGIACASRLAASIELGARVVRLAREPPRAEATCSADVEHWGRGRLVGLPHEELWVLLLDARNRIVAERQVGLGGTHACAVTARDVLRPIVREASSSFILVHNHPSGDPLPSREDVLFTHAIAASAAVVGVALIDHVVIARDGCTSMLETRLYDPLARSEEGTMS